MQKLIVFSGPPGVGKSTLSYKLAGRTGAAILTKDEVERSLEKAGIVDPRAAYDLLLDLTRLNLRNGVSVILDAVFGHRSLQEQLRTMALETESELYVIACTCSDIETWKHRVESRPPIVDGWTPADWQHVLEVQDYFQEWTGETLRLDAVQPFEENFQKVLVYTDSL